MRQRVIFVALALLVFFTLASVAQANSINSFTINSGNAYTGDAIIALNINASDCNLMKFSCDGATWSDYETYVTTKEFDLNSGSYGCTPAVGLRRVYLKATYTDLNESSGDHNDTITLDIVPPSTTSFSPANEIVAGNGASGQAISIVLADDYNLSSVSISLKRDDTTVYDNNTQACTIIGTTATCAFTDYRVDRGASYTYTYIVSDRAGNTKTDTNTFAFTDSVGLGAVAKPGGYVSDTNVHLSWARLTTNDFNKYAIYRSTLLGFDANTETFVALSDTNTYIDSLLDENTTYYYKIKGIDLTGNYGVASDENSFLTKYKKIVPTITRTDVSCDANTWCYDNSPTFSFETANSHYSWIVTSSTTTLPADCNYYSDCNSSSSVSFNQISNGTNYFKVKTCKPTGCSTTATYLIKTDATVPSVPTNVTATLSGYNVNIKWTASTDSGGSALKYYYIFRSESSSFYVAALTKLAYVDYNILSFLDTAAVRGKTYYYKVIAVDGAYNYSADYNVSPTKAIVPAAGEETTIRIKTLNSAGEDINYYTSTMDLNLVILFSKTVNDFNLFKKINDNNLETIVSRQNNLIYYDTLVVLSASYVKVRIDINALSSVGVISAQKTLYYDATKPTVSFSTLAADQEISGTFSVKVKATDNYTISKVDLFFGETKIGSATKSDANTWSLSWDTTKVTSSISSKKIKAVAYDGANNSASTELTISIDNSALPHSDTNTPSSAEKTQAEQAIATAQAKKTELENIFKAKNAQLSAIQAETKAAADTLLGEAVALIDTNYLGANQKAIAATNLYASMITEQNSGFLNISQMFSGLPISPLYLVIIVVVVVVVVVGVVVYFKKFKKPKNPRLDLSIPVKRV